MRKRAYALVMALIMFLMTVASPLMNVQVQAAEDGLKIQFHYLREDGNYDGWDLHVWDGVDGPLQFQKDDNGYVTDEFGAVAEGTVKADFEKVGFIVRQGGDSWTAKDPDGDRFVEGLDQYVSGVIHVYLTSGDSNFTVNYDDAVKAPEDTEVSEGLTIQFHYLREDGNYDGWNIAAWEGIDGCEFQKDENGNYIIDENGAVAEATIKAGSQAVQFIVRYSISGNEWADREYIDEEHTTGDRKVDVADYVSGTIHVYIKAGANDKGTVDYSQAVKSETKNYVEVKLHYERPDKEYEGWQVWMWDYSGQGQHYPFKEENGEMVATKRASSDTVAVGFIINWKNWADREWVNGEKVEKNVYIDISDVVTGTVHAYVKSGELTSIVVEAECEDDVVTGTKLSGVKYDAETKTIEVGVTAKLEDKNVFKVVDKENEFEIVEVTEGEVTEFVSEKEVDKTYESLGIKKYTYKLKLKDTLDESKAYNVVYNGKKYEVKMPSMYSKYSTEEFKAQYTYTGKDLGATWTKDATTFKVWAPTADKVSVNLYESGTKDTNDLIKTVEMTQADKGVWEAVVEGNLDGTYYTYLVERNEKTTEACDPYAKSTGVNGDRAMVLDMDSTDPEGWGNDKNPNSDITSDNFTDAVIYELHVRDASIDESSGVSEANKGNFLGLTEHGKNTVLDHMVDLGITHLHLLPVYDFNSVDETNDNGHNWGYDPKNYNVPEGSYSSDPYNGEVRVKEMKEMVQTLHENGISVVMDVVYNHVAEAENYCFNQIVPQYFSRMNEDGTYSGNSGCGNDTASEHVMVRKYIVDSVKYWADEYHIDGFRFDLVGLIDTVTINAIMEEVWEDHPDVIFYGEGWDMNSYDTGVSMTIQSNADEVPGFAFFNDVIRDTIKGSVWDEAPGYVGGKTGVEATIEQSFMGVSVWGSGTVCPTPNQTVNYNSCHDNNTLIDRIMISRPDATWEEHVKMNNLAAAITLTSQGVPFIHAAEEFLRSKPDSSGNPETVKHGYNHNSYNAGDTVNSIKWDELEDELHYDTYEYYKGLIEFRKDHAALRMTDAADVKASITALDGLAANVTAFEIDGEVANDDDLFVVFNPNEKATTVDLPEGTWEVYINGEDAGIEVLATVEDEVSVDAISAMVLVKAEEGTTPVTNPFVDVTESDYYYNAVLWAVENDVTAGVDETHFAPANTCTRAQVVTFLWRAAGSPEVTNVENPFVDVASDAYYYDAVLWALENGITAGVSADNFAPEATVTRAQVVSFLHRAENKPASSITNPFVDLGTDAYYYDAVLWALENGITAGVSADNFAPADSCTRAQVVSFLYRADK